MLKTLIDKEVDKFKKLGFSELITTVDVPVDAGTLSFAIGNDIYLFAGINVSEADLTENRSRVAIISATNSIKGTAQEIAARGVTLYKPMHGHIIVKTDDIINEGADILPYSLQFVKITPISKNTDQ